MMAGVNPTLTVSMVSSSPVQSPSSASMNPANSKSDGCRSTYRLASLSTLMP